MVRDDPVRSEYVDSIDAGDHDSAAGLYLRAKRDATDRTLTPGQRQEATRTLHAVNDRFPNAREHAANAADHELGIDGSPDLKRTRDQHRADLGVTAEQAAHARRQRARPTAPGGRARGTRSHGGKGTGAGNPRARGNPRSRSRAARATGTVTDAITDPIGGYGSLGLQVFGWGVGLSMLYLLLTKGTGAVQLAANGLRNTVAVLADPLGDPLNPQGRLAQTVRGAAYGTAQARRPAVTSAIHPATRVSPGTSARGTHVGGPAT